MLQNLSLKHFKVHDVTFPRVTVKFTLIETDISMYINTVLLIY